MRITTRAVWQMTADGGFELLERESFEYHGPLAQAGGGGSRSSSSSQQSTQTQNLNLQEIGGIAVAGSEGVTIRSTTTDQGTVDAARDIAITALDTGLTGFQEAGDLARDVLASSERQTGSVLDFAAGAQEGVFDVVDASQARAFDFAGDVNLGFQEALGGVTEDFIGAGQSILERVIDVVQGAGRQVVDVTERVQARESTNTDARLEEIARVALIGAGVVVVAVVAVPLFSGRKG